MKVEATIIETLLEPSPPRQSGWRIELGKLGERKARQSLEQLGWEIIAINWRSGRFGEIDIVARDTSGMLIFCEVKTRMLNGQCPGFRNEGFESVHWKKRRKILLCAMNYMRDFNAGQRGCRFDIIAIEYQSYRNSPSKRSQPELIIADLEKSKPVIRHVQGAFC